VATRPNILAILPHDVGDWLGCYGHSYVRTPHLDRLAHEGTTFDQYFCTAPTCSASRASIMTGYMPHTTGVLGLLHRGFDMSRNVVTLPQRLRDGGYRTTLIGLGHECRDPVWEGYADVRTTRKDAAWVSAEAERFLENEGGDERPFFLMLGTREAHRPFGKEYDEADVDLVKVPPYLPDEVVVRKDLARYIRDMERLDSCIGRVLSALERTGLAESTIVLFTTDHGPPLPRAKTTMYDPGLKTALLMRWPGFIPSGAREDALLSNVDLTPTLLDLVGIDVPSDLHGVNFAPRLTGKKRDQPREHLFAEMTWHGHYRPMRAIRTERYKYILNLPPTVGLPLPPEDGCAEYGRRIVETHFATPRPDAELYDLEQDPNETSNLCGEGYSDVEQHLRGLLQRWMKETRDPVLHGPVANPEPERAKREFWVESGRGFRLIHDWEVRPNE